METSLICNTNTINPQSVDCRKENFDTYFYVVNRKFKNYHFDNFSYGSTLQGKYGCFRSAYAFTEEVKQYHSLHNSLNGYKGKVASATFILRTNEDKKLSEALKALQTFILHLEAKYDISRDDLRYTFDGKNSIYIIFSERLFGGFEAHEHLPEIHSILRMHLTKGSFESLFDERLYSIKSSIPVIHTKHESFSVELTSDEVFSSAEEILKLPASLRRGLKVVQADELLECESLREIKEECYKIFDNSMRFLNVLYGEASPNGVIELRTNVPGEEAFHSSFFDRYPAVIKRSQKLSGEVHVYYGVATRKERKNGKKENCKELRVIYSDIDYGTEGHENKTTFETYDETLSYINSLKYQPTVLTHSGHGFQLLWKLNKPLELSVETRKAPEALMKVLNDKLGDPTQDITRIFRMPYTLNIKTERQVLCEIVSLEEDRIYQYEELECWIKDELKSIKKNTQKKDEKKKQPKEEIDVDRGNTSPEEEFEVKLPFMRWENVKKNCSYIADIYKKVEAKENISHQERLNVAMLLRKFEGGVDEVHKIISHCRNYDKEKTNNQLEGMQTNGYKPYLCENCCPEKCAAILEREGESPIAFGYKKSNLLPFSVKEEKNCYMKAVYNKKEKKVSQTMLTSFVIKPKELLVLKDGDCLKCDIISSQGNTYEDILIENTDWHSKQKFLKAAAHSDCVFVGSEPDLQTLCYWVRLKVKDTRTGTKVIGLHDDDTWVIKNWNITKEGVCEDLKVIPYQKGADAFYHRIEYKNLQPEEYSLLIKGLYSSITKINLPEVILPWLGWLFATPVKPKIMKVTGGFPLMFAHGFSGGGKTSTANEFSRMAGYTDPKPESCTSKSFPMLKILSATNSIPVVMDEFKPSDMKQEEKDNLIRYMRKSYSGETESKGRADQTVESYVISAPMTVMGEWDISEVAIRERVLVSSFSDVIKKDKAMKEAFNSLKKLPLEGFMPEYISFCLRQDIEKVFTSSLQVVEKCFADITVAPRVMNNLAVMVTGLKLFEEFGKIHGVETKALDLDKLLNDQLSEITGSKGGMVKNTLDYLLEEFSVMALNKIISEEGEDFRYQEVEDNTGRKKRILAIQFNKVFPLFKEHARKTEFEHEKLDKKSYLSMMDSVPYVLDKSRAVRFSSSGTKRCLCIDLKMAIDAGLILDGFRTDEVDDSQALRVDPEGLHETPVTDCYTPVTA